MAPASVGRGPARAGAAGRFHAKTHAARTRGGNGESDADRSYSETAVRASSVAAVAFVAAVLGGVSVMAVGRAAGWVGGSSVRTVVVTEPVIPSGSAEAAHAEPAAAPILGNGFRPDLIYARRARGVVTIYAFMPSAGASQGSGFVVSEKGYILTNSHVITSAG